MVNVPYLTTSAINWDKKQDKREMLTNIHSEPIEVLESKYAEYEYDFFLDPMQKQDYYFYNPETIVVIAKITDEEKAESLYI